jgi:glycosyltransferase involved in cell wall biosynthesis
MQKLKVIHMVEDLEVGGLEKVLATIVLGMNRDKYEVEIWCLVAGGLIADELEKKGIKVRVLGLKSYHNPIPVIKLASLLRRERVDIVHTHGHFPGMFARLSGLLAHIPKTITHIHTTQKRRMLVEKIFSIFSYRILCISQAVQEFMVLEEGVNRSKTMLIYNSIEMPEEEVAYEERVSIRKSFGFDRDDVVLIVVASLNKHKGHKILLEAFANGVKKKSNLKLLIVGVGPLEAKIRRHAQKLDLLSNVKFAGLRRDVPLLLSMSDIFVLPSVEREGLGLVIIEAMAMRKPVIGSELGGIPEVIENGVNGLLFPPGDTEKLSYAIDILASDKHLREQMGQTGRKVFEKKFTGKQMINAIEAIYDDGR